jgi:hypothetical protein
MVTWDERMTRVEPPAPQLELVEACWQLHSPATNRLVTCAVYQTDVGLELRAGFSEDDVLRTERIMSRQEGTSLAGQWKAAAIRKGWTEAPLA